MFDFILGRIESNKKRKDVVRNILSISIHALYFTTAIKIHNYNIFVN